MENTLYAYTQKFLNVKNQLDALNLDEDTVADTLESYSDDVIDKLENVVKYMREQEALAEMLGTEAKRLNEAAAKKKHKAEKLKEYVDQTMKIINATDIQAGLFRINYRKGSEVVEVDETKLPEQYWIAQDPKPLGKTDLKKLLKSGETIEGVQLVRKPDTIQIKE